MKKILLLAAMLSAAPAAQARVNLLEPWSPGADFDVPRKEWTHGAVLRLGSGDADLLEASYLLSRSVSADLEVGGSVGFASLDRPAPFDEDSGLTDLAVAAKYKFPVTSTPGSLETVAEAGLSLPTGDPDDGLGAGGVGLLLGWGLQTPVQSVTGYAHLGYRLYTEGNDTRFGNVFSFVLGARYPYKPGMSLTGDLRGYSRGKDKINGVRAPESAQEVYLSPGVEWAPARSEATFLANLLIGLSDESYDLGLMAGAKF